MEKVAVLAFDGSEDVELFSVIDILKRCGLSVDIFCANVGNDNIITTKSSIRFSADFAFSVEKMQSQKYLAFYMPGGSIEPAFNEFIKNNNELLKSALKNLASSGAIISANCIAPALLDSAHAFDFQPSRKIVSYPGTEINRIEPRYLKFENNSDIQTPKVHLSSDGDTQILTANGPAASVELGLTLAGLLADEETAKSVKAQMLYV